jgi:hypothetical protein
MFNKLLLKFLTLFFLFSTAACGQKETVTNINEIPPSHPRILLLQDEDSAIKKNIASDQVWKTTHEYILTECNNLMSKPPVERILIGRRLLDKSREALKRIFYLSYAYRITYEMKYVERASKELLAISAFSDWNSSHFLDVAEMTMAAAIGYDWLYYDLSPDSRNIIKNAIVEKGLKPSLLTANNSWAKGTNNWNQVCNAGMAYGALAVYEDEKELAIRIIERAVSSVTLPMGDYDPDGAYPEGFGYWGYGTSFHVMFICAMEKIFGDKYDLKITPGFMKTAGYLENMTGPTGRPFNYSDCGSGASMDPAMFWFAKRLDDPSLLWSERYHLINKKPSGDRLLPAVLIWSAGLTIDKITSPDNKIWIGQGKNPVALLRSSWNDPDGIFVGLKAGSPSVNHGHMDVGSFVMDAKGERWAMDFGMQDYNSLESAGVSLWGMAQNSQRWEVFRYNNFVHNTLTVNNQLQAVTGKTLITAYSDQPAMINAVTDITSVYNGQLKKSIRGIAIIDNRYVMVRDEAETLASETVIRWNLLTSAAVTITGKNSAELVNNGKKLIMKVIEPENITMKTWSTDPPHTYDAPNPGTIMTGFETTIPANSTASLIVLLLPEGSVENPAVTVKRISEWPVTSGK